MNTKLALFFSALALMSFNCQGKEYIGIDLGKTTFDDVKQKLDQAHIKYTVKFDKDDNGKDILDLPTLSFKQFPDWQKHGKVVEGEMHFINGKVDSFSASWEEGKEPLLFRNLCAGFSKKYDTIRYPATNGNDWDNVRHGTFKDESNVLIDLQTKQLWRNKLKPLNWHYITTVAYKDVNMSEDKKKLIEDKNKLVEEVKRTHDPDLKFAQEF